jgi:hypothetical protein
MKNKKIYRHDRLLKQERNSNQARALLGRSNKGTNGLTNQPTDKVSNRDARSRLKTLEEEKKNCS